MPDFSMYGPAESGGMQAVKSLQQLQLNSLAMEDTTAQIVERKAQTQATNSATQIAQQTQAAKVKQQQQLQLIALQDRGKSLGQTARDIMLIQPEEGAKLANIAAQIEQRTSEAQKNVAESAIKRLEFASKSMDLISGQLGNVTNTAEYNRVLDRVESVTDTKLPPALREADWSPDLKQSIQNAALGVKGKADLLASRIKATQEAKRSETLDRLNNVRIAKEEAETTLKRVQTANEVKNGGKNNKASTVPKADVDAALTLIKKNFPQVNTDTGGMHDNEAYYIAGEAQKILRQSPSMNREQAIQKAFNEHKEDMQADMKANWWTLGMTESPTGKVNFNPGSSDSTTDNSPSSTDDAEALAWAKANPNNHNAAKIRKANGL